MGGRGEVTAAGTTGVGTVKTVGAGSVRRGMAAVDGIAGAGGGVGC